MTHTHAHAHTHTHTNTHIHTQDAYVAFCEASVVQLCININGCELLVSKGCVIKFGKGQTFFSNFVCSPHTVWQREAKEMNQRYFLTMSCFL